MFGPDDLDGLDRWFVEHGYAVLRGLWPITTLDALTSECVAAQHGVIDGTLDERHGTTILIDDDAASSATTTTTAAKAPFANYVTHLTEIAPLTRTCITDPVIERLMRRWLGDDCWLLEHHRFGVVYQDARPGSESSYTRIGWHSDWQSAPHRAMWPSTAFTIHIDATSPHNGFLRVVPGSHRWATPAPYRNANGVAVPDGSAPWGGHTAEAPPVEMPLGFEKVPGEIALYCEVGDVLFHDAYLWHSAARATADDTVRRHVRGGYYVGQEPTQSVEDDFVKNAAR